MAASQANPNLRVPTPSTPVFDPCLHLRSVASPPELTVGLRTRSDRPNDGTAIDRETELVMGDSCMQTQVDSRYSLEAATLCD